MHKLFAKLNEKNHILSIYTDDFLRDTTGWIEIGEQEDRHYHESLQNDDGIAIYQLKDGKKTARPPLDIDAEQAINNAAASLAATDATMPRYVEDIIDTMTDTQRAKLAAVTKANYENKKNIRASYLQAKNML